MDEDISQVLSCTFLSPFGDTQGHEHRGRVGRLPPFQPAAPKAEPWWWLPLGTTLSVP